MTSGSESCRVPFVALLPDNSPSAPLPRAALVLCSERDKAEERKNMHKDIMYNIDLVENATQRILQEQERDLLRAFRARLFDMQVGASHLSSPGAARNTRPPARLPARTLLPPCSISLRRMCRPRRMWAPDGAGSGKVEEERFSGGVDPALTTAHGGGGLGERNG